MSPDHGAKAYDQGDFAFFLPLLGFRAINAAPQRSQLLNLSKISAHHKPPLKYYNTSGIFDNFGSLFDGFYQCKLS
jgi:hypothetical protein